MKALAAALTSATLGAALALSPSLARGEGPAWEKISDSDGIIVYQKKVEGTSTVSLRGEAQINATVSDVFAVMKDNQRASAWIPMVAEKRDLRKIDANSRLEYTHVAMPWPLVDRYFINVGKVEYLPQGVLRVSVKSADAPEYREDDKVLGQLLYSEFLLTPTATGTHLKLEVNTDPKGAIPTWIVNLAQRSWPRDFIEGLRAQLAKGKAGVVAH